MSIRPIKRITQSQPTIEGAGVRLRRAFGFGKTSDFDPFLFLDDFRNENPQDYLAGFPWHPFEYPQHPVQTHRGRNPRVRRPTTAAPKTSHIELKRNLASKIRLTANKTTLVGSINVALASCQVTTVMKASEAALTLSRNAPAVTDRRTRGTSGPLAATKRNAGRKMPMVATAAPALPPRTYPIKVAVVKTGPGVA